MYKFATLVIIIIFGILGSVYIFSKDVSTNGKIPIEILQINKLSKLSTVEYITSVTLALDKNKQVFEKVLPGTDLNYIATAKGKVIAGVDLSKLGNDDIKFDTETKRATIKLPDAEIFEKYIDPSTVDPIEQNSPIFNKLKIEDVYGVQADKEEEMVQQAIDDGILRLAKANAQSTINNLISSLGYEVEFITN